MNKKMAFCYGFIALFWIESMSQRLSDIGLLCVIIVSLYMIFNGLVNIFDHFLKGRK